MLFVQVLGSLEFGPIDHVGNEEMVGRCGVLLDGKK